MSCKTSTPRQINIVNLSKYCWCTFWGFMLGTFFDNPNTNRKKKQQFSLSSWELLSFFQDKDFNLIEYIVFLAKPQPYNYTPDCRHLFPGKFDRYTYWRIHIYIDIPCLAENHVRLPQVLDRVFPRRILWDNMNPHPISQTSLTFYTQTSLDTGKNGRHPHQMHDFTATYVWQ